MKIQNLTILAATCSALMLVGCATHSTGTGSTSDLPEILRPPAGEVRAFSLTARGVQIYECKAKKDDAIQFEWTLKMPDADLFDGNGRKVGSHFKGPTWKHNDGSSVVGEKPQPFVKDATAIPWLLLRAKETAGKGVLSKVTSIQRINTVGGKSPAGGCDGASVGNEIRVPYTATYNFYVAKP